MNYLKRIGRLVAICICAVCVGIIPITAHAMEVSDKQIQPRMDYISSYGTELTISDSGEASVTGFVRGKKRVTNAYVKVTLQNILKGTKFAFQGRMQATSIPFADNKWGGDLTY